MHVLLDDWLEAGGRQWTQILPSKALVAINQAGRRAGPYTNLDPVIQGAGSLSDTAGPKLLVSLLGGRGHRGRPLSLGRAGESFPPPSRLDAVLSFCLSWGTM